MEKLLKKMDRSIACDALALVHVSMIVVFSNGFNNHGRDAMERSFGSIT